MNDDFYKNLLATSASLCTVVQFLSGITTVLQIMRNKSTGDVSHIPFLCAFISTSLWLRYGFLIEDTSLILVNSIGVSLFICYVLVFVLYSIKKTQILRMLIYSIIGIILVLLYLHRFDDKEVARFHLGLICIVATCAFFAAPFVSLMHVLKVKNTESLPYHLILATFVVSLQWMIYGVLLDDVFIQLPNFVGCVFSGIQLSLFIIYPSKSPKNYSSNVI